MKACATNNDFPAFIIGSAIPQLQAIIGLFVAVGAMQFTYTFLPLLWFGYEVVTDAMIEDTKYSPGNGSKGRIDNWKQWSRWKRVNVSARMSMFAELKSATGALQRTLVF